MNKEGGSRKVRKTGSPKVTEKVPATGGGVPGAHQPESDKTELHEPENTNHDTEQMEVHHHPQLEHKPKPWKEYLLEGLMIFLAVSMGFFAESFREHLSDRSKEKEYLTALRSEMKEDSAAYAQSLKMVYYMRPMLDSLFINASNPDRYNYTLVSKWNEPVNERAVTFLPALAIIQQLKSSGNLRLIDKKEIGRKIIKYETYVEGVYKRYYNSITDASGKLYSIEDEICDYKDFSSSINRAMLSKNFSVADTSIYYDMPIKIRSVGATGITKKREGWPDLAPSHPC